MDSVHSLSACSLCGHSPMRELFSKFTRGKTYSFLRCSSCEFVTVSPYPTQEELAHFYKNSYDVGYMASESKRLSELYAKRLEILLRHKTGGTLLEAGCGSGAFLRIAKKHFDVRGFDYTPDTLLLADPELNVQAGDILSYPSDRQFDVVALFHVIEHLHDPKAAVKKLASLCTSGGIVYLICPNADSLAFKLWGKRWLWCNPPLHLGYFNAKSLTELLKEHGFSIQEVRTQRGDDSPFIVSGLLWALDLVGILEKSRKPRAENAPSSGTNSRFGLYEKVCDFIHRASRPFAPFSRALDLRGLGSELIVIARK